MATKIVVIDVDLGASVDDIIAESVQELTGAARSELTKAIDLARDTQKVKQDREQATKQAADKIDTAMAEAHAALLAAGDVGLAVNVVVDMVKDAVPNLSAFSLRMKKILSSQGNLHILERFKKVGVPHYRLVPFNQPITPQDD